MTAPELEATVDLGSDGRSLYYVRPRGDQRWRKIARERWFDLVDSGRAERVR